MHSRICLSGDLVWDRLLFNACCPCPCCNFDHKNGKECHTPDRNAGGWSSLFLRLQDPRTFDHGFTQILHDDLHWLDVADRVRYKLCVILHRCQHGKAPRYLVNCCTPVTDVLRSATHQLMVVPRHRLSTVDRRAFAVQGLTVWDSLPDDLCATSSSSSSSRNEYYLGGVMALLLQDHRTMLQCQ